MDWLYTYKSVLGNTRYYNGVWSCKARRKDSFNEHDVHSRFSVQLMHRIVQSDQGTAA